MAATKFAKQKHSSRLVLRSMGLSLVPMIIYYVLKHIPQPIIRIRNSTYVTVFGKLPMILGIITEAKTII